MSDVATMQVTNRNTFPLAGRYAAIDYEFPPGKATELPREAANHIFGLGQQDKTRALNCMGILKAGVTYKEALAVLDKVIFAEGRMVYETQQEHEPGHKQPGHKPGEQPKPEPEPKGPGKDEDEDEEESGDSPGAPRSPGRKSEGVMQTIAPSGDLKPGKRHW